MLDTSSRLLRLLSVLQARRFWSGSDLASRLEVTPRTLRRDIDRLRSLGYAIEATSGHGGGYQLGMGAAVPPLLLDDEEAVAVSVALRSATDAFAGVAETAVRVLAKLDQLLPNRLRKQIGALHAMTVSVHGATSKPLHPDLLSRIAAACRDCTRLTFAYRDRAGNTSIRRVEPLRLAHTAWRRWYLLAWDCDRESWRTFRVDRIDGTAEAKERFVPRTPPADVADYVSEALANASWRHRARIRLRGSMEELASRIPGWVGTLEPHDESSCVLRTGSDSIEGLACHLILCGQEFELLEPLELAPRLDEIAARLRRGSSGSEER